jgi:hypothetical protein
MINRIYIVIIANAIACCLFADGGIDESDNLPEDKRVRQAIEAGDIETIKLFVPKRSNWINFDVNTARFVGEYPYIKESPLMCAIRFGQLEIVKYLHENGATSPYGVNYSKDTPLMWATRYGYIDIVNYLLDDPLFKKEINFADADGNTALHWAAMKGQIPIAVLLFKNGANVYLKNIYGKTVNDKAIEAGFNDFESQLSLKSDLQKNDEMQELKKYGWINIQKLDIVPLEYQISLNSKIAFVNNKKSVNESLYGYKGKISTNSILFDDETYTISKCFYGKKDGEETIIMYTKRAMFVIKAAPMEYQNTGRYILTVVPTINNFTLNFLIE